MGKQRIASFKRIFETRLDTLSHLLDVAESHFSEGDEILQRCIAPDMFPFGTQIAFTCNQPRGFALWCKGKPIENLSPEVKSVAEARGHIATTKELLNGIEADDSKLTEVKRIELGQGLYAELPGQSYTVLC